MVLFSWLLYACRYYGFSHYSEELLEHLSFGDLSQSAEGEGLSQYFDENVL